MLQIVQTKAGKIAGTVEEYAAVFKGIPYAEPPVGEWRFRRPETVRAWEGIFQADKFPKRALQLKGDPNETFYTKEFYQDPVYQTEVSEDCLYLNIWVPLKRQAAPFPVAFFIHGGAFNHGTGHEVEFRTQEYARRGIILVTINYRLGLAGFLAHPLLQQEDALACGNYGILDQMKALEWVRENIGAFGGDPVNITIFGRSSFGAGAAVCCPGERDVCKSNHTECRRVSGKDREWVYSGEGLPNRKKSDGTGGSRYAGGASAENRSGIVKDTGKYHGRGKPEREKAYFVL